MADETKPPEGFMSNFAMMMPKEPVKMKKHVKIFGWYILWTGINVRLYKSVIPTRQDWIFDFFCWKFVKPIKRKPSKDIEVVSYGFREWKIDGFDTASSKYLNNDKEK